MTGQGLMNGVGRSYSSIENSWIYRATTAQFAAVAVVFGLGIWALIAGLDLLAMSNDLAAVPMSMLDSLVGLLCGTLLFMLMQSQRSRYRQMSERIRTIAEVNHHIRNALDRIELTVHITHNQQLIADIAAGTERIQWTLRELLPELGEENESILSRSTKPVG